MKRASSQGFGHWKHLPVGVAQLAPGNEVRDEKHSAEVSPRRKLPFHEAEQFSLFDFREDFFDDDLLSYIPRGVDYPSVHSVALVLKLHLQKFRTFSPFEWPENFSKLCVKHGGYKSYWRGVFQ